MMQQLPQRQVGRWAAPKTDPQAAAPAETRAEMFEEM